MRRALDAVGTLAQQLRQLRGWRHDQDLIAGLDTPLPATLPVGEGTVLVLNGWCFHPASPVARLELVVNGTAYPAAAAGLRNLRVYQHDAVEVLRDEVAPGSLDEVRIYFPDPWHKKRHHKRRLVQPAFAALLCERLRPGGRLHLATDWEPYAEHMFDVLEAEPRLRNVAGPRTAVPRPDTRRQTHFEARGLKLGHGVWDLLYDRT